MGHVIELLMLQALAHHAQGDTDQAMPLLERALSLAEPEGYARTFVDEGEPMKTLLRQSALRGIAPGYVGKLLAVFEAEEQGRKKVPLHPFRQSFDKLRMATQGRLCLS